MLSTVLAVFIFTILFLFGTLIWWLLRPVDKPIVEYNDRLPEANYSYRTFAELHPFDRSNMTIDGQSDAWKQSMLSLGKILRNANVKHIYFVPGTFTGNDTAKILDCIKSIFPDVNKLLAAKIAKAVLHHKDGIPKDTGHFTKEYVHLYSRAIGNLIPCTYFQWPCGNHHFARLKGAVELALRLSKDIAELPDPPDKFLLIGHGHAGQIFALLAHLMDWNQLGKYLIDIAERAGYNRNDLFDALRRLSQVTLDFVTLGTPILYTWPDSGYYRLLHIINHRGPSHLCGGLRDILHTKDGDYIQHLAILGTDLLASTWEDRRFNRRLEEVLGSGRNIWQWRDAVRIRMRVPPVGKTLLVNYGDDSEVDPNFYKTFFGHGCYTTYEAMLFNTKMVASQLYRVFG